MVEPSFNYYNGNFKVNGSQGSFTGEVTGLNLGYMGNIFMAGLALERGNYVYDSDVTTDGYQYFLGGGVGTYIAFHFFDRIRLWTGYLNSVLEPKSNTNVRYFGQHVSIGLGLRVYDGFMLNIQDFRNQYTQQEDDVTGKTTGLPSNIKTQGLVYGLSYIFAF